MDTPVDKLIDLVYPDLKEEMTVVTPADIPHGKLMHISTNNKIDSFTPFVSLRVGDKTDRRVPRICTANSLAGCIMGYYGDWWDFEDGTENNESFLGGYVIYDFDFDYAIKPSKKLVGDVDITNEHWLVTYDDKTAKYIPKQAGKFFVMEVKLTRYIDEEVRTLKRDTTYYVEVFDGNTVPWDQRTILEPGYYRIYVQALMWSRAWDQVNPYSVEKLTKEEYEQGKKLTASLLGLVEAPRSAQW